MGKNGKFIAIILIAIILVAVGGTALLLGKKSDKTSKDGRTTQTAPTDADTSDDVGEGMDGMDNMDAGSGSSDTEAVATTSVDIADFAFSHDVITVKKGSTVTWTNKDSADHTVTAEGDNGGPDSGTISQGKTFSYTFNKVGTFSYICSFHTSMKGEVIVTE